MTDQTEPIRASLLPCIPPPEWEFHTWYPRPDGGGDLSPGQHDRGVHVRRRVTYGDWEPVRPDHWAAEPGPADLTGYLAPDPAIGCLTVAAVEQATTLQPAITHTHTWDGTGNLPDWLHHDSHLTLPGRDDNTPPRPGWTLVRWSDGHITVASPQVAARVYGPDGMRGRLERAEAELADRDAAESADAAAGSYAGRAEAAEAVVEQVRAECDRLDAAVHANPTNPDFDGAYLAAIRHIRTALIHDDYAIVQPEPWLHVAFTSPDATTANTSALVIADHLAAEFDGVHMRITTNAVEAESVIVCTTACDEQHTYDWTCEQFAGIDNGTPSCSPGAEETEPNNPAATEATDVGTEFVQQADHPDKEALAKVEAELATRCDHCKQPGHSFEDCPDNAADETEADIDQAMAGATPVELAAPTDLRERLRAAIESEMYEYRERTMWWPEETGGVTKEIARLATRGVMEALGQKEQQP